MALVGAPAASLAQAARQPAGAIRVCAGGDVSLGTNLDTSWAVRASAGARRAIAALPDPSRLVAPLHALVRDAEVVLLNVEGAIGTGAAGAKCSAASTHCYALRQQPAAAAALRSVAPRAIVVGNVANNHARDAGAGGFDETRARLAGAGVLVTGADTLATLVPLAGGDSLAILGFSTSAVPDARDLDAVARHVARAAAAHRRVVVTMHLGAEGAGARHVRDSSERYVGADRGNPVAFADAAVAAGADLVIGHGPHVLRAAEWQGPALVVYSLGNLLTYGAFSFAPPLDRGAVLCATLGPDGDVSDAVLRPTRQWPPGHVTADASNAAWRLVRSLDRADFPLTGAEVDPRGRLARGATDPAPPRRRRADR